MKKGFTLAEVLITLAVIGVVATLTMPNLIGNYQNRVLITQLQKTLNTVQNSIFKYMEETTAENFRTIVSTTDNQKNFLKNYFDSVNICDDTSGFENCLGAKYTSFDKNASNDKTGAELLYATIDETGTSCAITTSGSAVCINEYGGTGTHFVIDVNGSKPPNVNGKDVFWFWVGKNGKIIYSAAAYDNPDLVTNSGYDVSMQKEANGDTCKTSSINLRDVCLPYIISHGWEFKF